MLTSINNQERVNELTKEPSKANKWTQLPHKNWKQARATKKKDEKKKQQQQQKENEKKLKQMQ